MTNRVVWAGRYAVFDEIASGGMASVFLACRLEAGDGPRVVAIKKMFESFAKRPEFVTMFLDEAHIAARIRHPNVVTTHEFLRIPDSLGIVMDFVLGVSLVDLSRIVQDRGNVAPLPVTLAIVRDALAGLHAAHETKDEGGDNVGLVHRDVSPHNVIVGKDGVARVIDFGIAKAAGRLQVTEVGVMKGKYAYMAPEQIRAGEVDRRVDVYSMGIVLWEAVTGQTLFEGSTDAGMFSQRGAGTAPVPPPSLVRAGVSPELDAVILKALEFDPDHRFQTAKEMSQALLEVEERALPSEVAAWVTGLAGSRLRELEAMRNEVETAYATGELAALAPTLVSHRAPSSPVLPSLELDIPELAAKPAPPKPAAKPPSQAPASSKKKPPSQALSPIGDAFDDAPGEAVKLDLAVPMAAPVSAMSRSLDARHSRASVHAFPADEGRGGSRRRGGGGLLFLFVLLVAGAGAAYVFGPGFLKTAVVAAAGRRGLVLSAESIVPRSGGLALSGVTLELPGVKGVRAKASEVELDLDWQGNVKKVAVPGYELTVHGNASDVATALAAWRASPHLAVAFEAKAGHLVWSDLLAPGVQAEGINVVTSLGLADEGALSVDAPSLTLTLPRGSVGPWRAHLDSTAGETKLTVSLDRSKPDGPPSLVVVSRPTLGTVVTATVPRTKAVGIGVPADFFLAGSDPEVDVALEAQVMPGGEPVNAHATVSLFGLATGAQPAVGAPVDLVLDGNIHGDSSKPLHIDPGTLTIGKVKTHITGDVTLTPDSIRIEVERPAGRASAPPPPFVVDTHEWTAPKDAAPAPKPAASSSAAPVQSSRPHR